MHFNEVTLVALISKLIEQIDASLENHLPQERFAILDFPDHSNVGDSAIWLGEQAFFKKKLSRTPSYVCKYNDFNLEDLNHKVPSGPIFIHGGGNFGDIWDHHHRLREYVIEQLPNRKIVQLPQSIQFWSEKRRDQTARLIGNHTNFTLMVRDKFSLDFARRHFNCDVQLVPDMAFYMGKIVPLASTRDVLALLRTDSEAVLEVRRDPTSVDVEDWLNENVSQVRIAKALGLMRGAMTLHRRDSKEALLDAAAKQRVRRGLRQLSSARAIITDRLHAHILSLLLGRPHAVLDNNYGKISRFMEAWSGGSPLTHVSQTLSEATDWARAAAHGNDGL